jgi:hypothetical protein
MQPFTVRALLGWGFGIVGAVAIVAGCSGSNNAVQYQNPRPPSPLPLTTVQVTITLPTSSIGPRKAASRSKRAISASDVESVTVQAAAGNTQAPPVTIETSQGAKDCSTSGGTLTCTGSLQAPIANNVAFAIVAYGQPNAQGAPVSAGTVVQNVPATGATLTVGPSQFDSFGVFIASLTVSLDNATLHGGTPGTFTFSFIAYDASGTQIAAPATFANPILLSFPSNATSGIFGLIPSPGATPNYFTNDVPPVTQPGVSLSFGYSGLAPGFSPGANPFTFPVSVSGVSPSQISGNTTVTVLLPSPSPAPTLLTPSPVPTSTATAVPTTTPSPLPTFTAGPITLNPSALYFGEPTDPPQTFTASEPGVSSFSASVLDPSVVSVSPSHGTTFTVTPLSAGLTLVIVKDAKGNANGVDIYVNQIIVNPQAKTRFR